MGILDGIVEWIAEQVMNGLDLISTPRYWVPWAVTWEPSCVTSRLQRQCIKSLLLSPSVLSF